MSKISHRLLRNKKVSTTKGMVQFDENGIAEVTEEVAAVLVTLPGYTLIDGEDAEIDEGTVTDDTSDTEEENDAKNAIEDELAGLNVPQLRKYAKEHGIDLMGAAKRDEIMAIIVGAAN